MGSSKHPASGRRLCYKPCRVEDAGHQNLLLQQQLPLEQQLQKEEQQEFLEVLQLTELQLMLSQHHPMAAKLGETKKDLLDSRSGHAHMKLQHFDHIAKNMT